MSKLAIFDLDGCLSDDRWRQRMISTGNGQEGYQEYHAAAPLDSPFEECLELVREAMDRGYQLAIITARPRWTDPATRHWLRGACGIPDDSYFLMSRNENDLRPSPALKIEALFRLTKNPRDDVAMAVDDRQDVLDAYRHAAGVWPDRLWRLCVDDLEANEVTTAADVLAEAAETFAERNKVYGSNYERVAPVMKAMFPDGVPSHLPTDNAAWHLFELVVVKLTRFATSELTHEDSIHDAAVYAAMIEAELKNDREN